MSLFVEICSYFFIQIKATCIYKQSLLQKISYEICNQLVFDRFEIAMVLEFLVLKKKQVLLAVDSSVNRLYCTLIVNPSLYAEGYSSQFAQLHHVRIIF